MPHFNKNRVIRELIHQLPNNFNISVRGSATNWERYTAKLMVNAIEEFLNSNEWTLDIDQSQPNENFNFNLECNAVFDDDHNEDDEENDEEEDEEAEDIGNYLDLNQISQSLSQVSAHSSGSEYLPTPPTKKAKIIPLDAATISKYTDAIKLHPNWNAKSMKINYGMSESMFYKLKNKLTVPTQSYRELIKVLDDALFELFLNTREDGESISDYDLRMFALQICKLLNFSDFTCSRTWITDFKKRHNIGYRKIMHFKTAIQIKNWPEIYRSGANFVEEVNGLFGKLEPSNILNTDQTGCQLEAHRRGTLELIGTKEVVSKVGKIDALTHTYTAQYTIRADGSLTPNVFICLKETLGHIPPTLKGNVGQLVQNLGNVFVTSTKTGPMSYAELDLYIENSFFPFLGDKNLLICDSWTPFIDKNSNMSQRAPYGKQLVVKNIPGKTTGDRQPLDRGFFRTLKSYIKRISDQSLYHLDFKSKLYDRMTIITLQSILHNQLRSPRCREFVINAWQSCGYNVQTNGNIVKPLEFSFNFTNKKQLPDCEWETCEQPAFIRCMWCKQLSCFVHFFYNDKFHFSKCNNFVD
jgi:hypothetical protein